MTIFHTNIIRRALPFALAAAFAGCEQAKPRVYFQPKELPPPPEATPAPEPPPAPEEPPSQPLPRVTYNTPAGWKDAGPDRMNIARFAIEAGGGTASVNVTPLPLLEGRDTFFVNMWREQVGEPQLGDAEAEKALRDVDIGGAKGRQFDVAGKREGQGLRIVTAFLRHGDRCWFFKLQGDLPAVEATLPVFADFLKSVKFEAPAPLEKGPDAAKPAETAPPAAAAPPSAAPPAGDLPAGWAAVAPGPMQAAKFTLPGKDGTKAEVTVSIFPADTGGTVANVKRWRGQVGLPDADDAAILASAKPIEGLEGAVMVELDNAGRALTGAIVPRGGQWYFYKLMGGTPAVAAARQSFVDFVKRKP